MQIVIQAKKAVILTNHQADLVSDVIVTVQNGRIESIEAASTFSQSQVDQMVTEADEALVTPLLLPGFVDIHSHGLGGHEDVACNWMNPEHTLSRLPSRGTTSTLASLIPSDQDSLQRCVDSVTQAVGSTAFGAILEGIHAEGPMIADLGALPASEPMSEQQFQALLDQLGPHLKVMTLAPSIDADMKHVPSRELHKRGVRVAMGHDRSASHDAIVSMLHVAQEYQQRLHITHLFNVCKFHHRQPSLINFGLLSTFPPLPEYQGLESPTVEVIVDDRHVHLLTIASLCQARNPADVAGITDNIMSGQPGTKGLYCGREVRIAQDGKAVEMAADGTLAGSCASLWQSFLYLRQGLQLPLVDVVTMLSQTPARIARLPDIGSIHVGAYANLLCVDTSDNNYQLQNTLVHGCLVYSSAK